MTPEQFVYWLQGFAELQPTGTPTAEQWQSIKEHLSAVLTKVTPAAPGTRQFFYGPGPHPWNDNLICSTLPTSEEAQAVIDGLRSASSEAKPLKRRA